MLDAARKTQLERVADLARLGLSPAEMSALLGTSAQTVSNQLATARSRWPDVPAHVQNPKGRRHVRITLPYDVSARLRIEAARRGITVDDLTLRLLTVISEDGMVDAILDDGVDA